MKKLLIFLLFSSFLLTGCTIQKNGSDLTGFILKMNEKNESYNLTADGFLCSSENDDYYKFFKFDEAEILLSFCTDDKGRLIQMNIVASKDFYSDESQMNFVESSIFSFIDNDNITNIILDEIDFYNSLNTVNKDTKKAKNGNIAILLDVTEIGTVITVYKDI